MKSKVHCRVIRCVEFQLLFQCRGRSLSSEVQIRGLLAPCDELSVRETEIEAADKVELIGKGKTKGMF